MDRSEQRSCIGKADYRDRILAKNARRRMAAIYPEWHFVIYRCDFCGRWHVGRRRSKNSTEASNGDLQ
jgi:hypothetical protein